MSVEELNPDDIRRIEGEVESLRGIVDAELFPQDKSEDGIRITATNVTSLTKSQLRDLLDGRVHVQTGFEDTLEVDGDREVYFIPIGR